VTRATDKATARHAKFYLPALVERRWHGAGATVLIALESVPQAITAGEASLYQRARVRMSFSPTPLISAARSGG